MRRVLFLLPSIFAATVPLVTFDGAPGTGDHVFHELNDPVMGGKSTGTWSLDTSGGKFGVFNGTVVNVPSLKAPGFITAETDASGKAPFADASSALGGDLVLTLRTSTAAYTGFRVSFAAGAAVPAYACAGGGSIPLSRGCYKANFTAPAGADFQDVRVPFAAFSDLWSPATGQQTKTCADDPSVCPTAKGLAKIQRMQVWAEGVGGHVHLELKSVRAEAASAASAAPNREAPRQAGRPPAAYDTCSAAVQPKLRFNISSRTTPEVPAPVDPSESLATAVCCDSRASQLAEPQFLFLAPDIALFDKLPKGGEASTFYDSACGAPLFVAPTNRSLADFASDSNNHGWPSFREAEVNLAHVRVNKETREVTSSCGTHLGTFLPDEQGARYCIDLSCVSGHAA